MIIDSIHVENEQEALILMRYHLRLAALYFEATPEKYPADFFNDEFSERAMSMWITRMEELYPDE